MLIKFTSYTEAKMTDDIISVPLFSGNTNKKGDKENEEKQQKYKNRGLSAESEEYGNIGSYVEYSNAKEMIKKLLTCERMVPILTRVPSFTILELAKELDIAPVHLKHLAPDFYEQMAWKINPLLVRLYCSTRFFCEPAQKKSYNL